MKRRQGADIEADGALSKTYWDNPVFPPSPDSSSPPRQFHLVIQCDGTGRVVQGNWEVALYSGDIALCSDVSPHWSGQGTHVLLAFSVPFKSEIPAGLKRLLPAVLSGSHPAARLLSRMIDLWEHASAELGPGAARHFVGGLLSLFEAALEEQAEAPPPILTRLTRFHLARIKDYLRQHARDPGLTVADIAQALELSVSHIHRLFAQEGNTVARWLWAQRLESCALELSSTAHAHRTVGEIALDWGFSDLSHFSRSFRKRFGLSPKEWRKRSLWRPSIKN